MKLGVETEDALNAWLSLDTWHTPHPLDMGRFYNFLDSYVKEHGYSFDRTALREEIVQRVSDKGRWDDHLQEEVENRIDRAEVILDFLKETRQ